MAKELTPITTTAFRVMFYVALEQYQPAERRLIHDDLARRMLPGGLRLAADLFRLKPLRRRFLAMIDRQVPGMSGGFSFCRKRYIDQKLVEALANGIEAVLILGAGLDTRAYRLPPLSSLPIYEVDLPQIIAYKESKIRQILGAVPGYVRLVPIDFDRQELAQVLASHGYSSSQKSFVIWEGVTQYISATAVSSVFTFLASLEPASRLIFTYILKDFIDGTRTHGLEQMYQQTRLKQQIWQFGMRPDQVGPYIGQYGWKEIEQLGPEAFRQRFLTPVGRTDPLLEIERAVYAEKISGLPAAFPDP